MRGRDEGAVGLAFVGFVIIILGFRGTWKKVFTDLWSNAPTSGKAGSLQQSQSNAQSQGGTLQAPGPPPVAPGPTPGDASTLPPGYPNTATAFTNNIGVNGVTV